MKIFGIVGWSGSGKTTLLAKLLPELIATGLTVSTMKHAHHGFDLDQAGKDSHRHRTAGATEVMITSEARWALMHENRDQPEPEFDDLVAAMTRVDLLLIEGFKSHPHAKVEIHRPSLGKPPLFPEDPSVVAVAADNPLPGVAIPVLDLDDAAAIASFIIEHCQLRPTSDRPER